MFCYKITAHIYNWNIKIYLLRIHKGVINGIDISDFLSYDKNKWENN